VARRDAWLACAVADSTRFLTGSEGPLGAGLRFVAWIDSAVARY
jgi:hypothetical protein